MTIHQYVGIVGIIWIYWVVMLLRISKKGKQLTMCTKWSSTSIAHKIPWERYLVHPRLSRRPAGKEHGLLLQ